MYTDKKSEEKLEIVYCVHSLGPRPSVYNDSTFLMFKQIFRAGQRSCVEYCVRREGLGLRLLCVH